MTLKTINKSNRDDSIDILRFLAITGIIIAHCNPNQFFVQLRGFDVVLMVFLSSVCNKKIGQNGFNYFDYLIRRFVRLVLPVWIFFVFYYIGVHIFYFLPSLSEIVSTFTLTSDRYVWIIRILVFLAIIAPVIYRITHKLSKSGLTWVLTISFVIVEVIFLFVRSSVLGIFLITIPYGLVYLIGLNINSLSIKQQKTIAIILSCCFIIIAVILYCHKGQFIMTSNYKYPPRFYYISYGLAITLFLWIYRNNVKKFMQHVRLFNFSKYVGRHTYWLYLWHIPIVDVVGNNYNALVRFIIIFVGALICVYIQNLIVRRFVSNKYLIAIFNG